MLYKLWLAIFNIAYNYLRKLSASHDKYLLEMILFLEDQK